MSDLFENNNLEDIDTTNDKFDELVYDDFFYRSSDLNLERYESSYRKEKFDISDLFDISILDYNHTEFLNILDVEIKKYEQMKQKKFFSPLFTEVRKKIHEIELEEKSFYVSMNCSYDIIINDYIDNPVNSSEIVMKKLKKIKKTIEEKYFVD